MTFLSMIRSKFFLVAVLLFFTCRLQAEVTLPEILGSNMVLQRNKPLPIWGTASAGEEVTIRFGNQVKKATTNSLGRWEVILDPMPASQVPAEMTVSGKNTLLLKNILVGEVWLCSGQSNMEFTMNKSSKYAKANKSQGLTEEKFEKIDIPDLRVFLVKRNLYDNDGINRGWEEAKYEALKDFSAAGYFFGEKLHQELNVPVGVISSAVSGSPIERWAPEEVFRGKPDFKAEVPLLPEAIDELNDGKFYYGMIQPLAPFAMRGFLWYQGETNCLKNETFQYTDKMQALINTWRYIWRDQEMPFYYVQLVPFQYSHSKGGLPHTEETLPEFWEAQAAALQVPHTGMVVTTDLSDNLEDIHPTYKWEIGRRLALWPLAKVYGKDVVFAGPMYTQMQIKGNKAILQFTNTGSGLVSLDKKPLNWFTVAGADGEFVPARAVIKGDRVVVSAPGVSTPTAVRFAWNEAAQPNLFNREGLPAAPFRTDGPHWQKEK
jgi:sialate O-acetylesterase